MSPLESGTVAAVGAEGAEGVRVGLVVGLIVLSGEAEVLGVCVASVVDLAVARAVAVGVGPVVTAAEGGADPEVVEHPAAVPARSSTAR
jgi:hypothetical protein